MTLSPRSRIRQLTAIVALGASLVLVASDQSAMAVPPTFVLGEKDNGAFVGLGVAHPRRFASLAGSESYFSLRWRSWGSKRTTASGRFSTGRGPSRAVKLTAYGRGTNANCAAKKYAYSRLRIAFPGHTPFVIALCQR